VILLLALCAITSLPPEPEVEVWRQTFIRGLQGTAWPGHDIIVLEVAEWPAAWALDPPVGEVTQIELVDEAWLAPFMVCDYPDGSSALNLLDPGLWNLP